MLLADENQHQFYKTGRTENILTLAISLWSRVSLSKLVHFSTGGKFYELGFNETYNYDTMDMRFFFCMNLHA